MCIYVTILKELSNEFGINIPRSLPYEGGNWGFYYLSILCGCKCKCRRNM